MQRFDKTDVFVEHNFPEKYAVYSEQEALLKHH